MSYPSLPFFLLESCFLYNFLANRFLHRHAGIIIQLTRFVFFVFPLAGVTVVIPGRLFFRPPGAAGPLVSPIQIPGTVHVFQNRIVKPVSCLRHGCVMDSVMYLAGVLLHIVELICIQQMDHQLIPPVSGPAHHLQAAKTIMERHSGIVPSDPDALASLPGLGSYTASAIRAIAFEQDVVPVDANVERVFSRLLDIAVPIKKKVAADIVKRESLRLLPRGQARDYAQALMELGALVCGKAPKCAECPLRDWCQARRLGVERERPVTQTRAETVPVTSAHGILMVEKHALLVQRPQSGLWGGMWEFPGIDSVPDVPTAGGTKRADSEAAAALLRVFAALGIETEILAPLGTVSHSYTNHRLTAHFYRLASPCGLTMQALSEKLGDVPHRFVRWDKTGELAMPAHHRKMAERYFSGRKHSIAEQCTL